MRREQLPTWYRASNVGSTANTAAWSSTIDDPESLGRLTVRVPSVLGSEVVTGWAMPCVPYGGDQNQGFLCIPEPGAGVWVEFEEGDLEFPIWVGTFWSKPGGDSELPRPNNADGSEQQSVQSPPNPEDLQDAQGPYHPVGRAMTGK